MHMHLGTTLVYVLLQELGGFFHHLNVKDWQQTALLEKAS